MIIRPEQMEVFELRAKKEFESVALEHLRTELEEITSSLTDEELLARIRDCGSRAESYGLQDRDEVLSFIDSSYLVDDPNFDINPAFRWAQRILTNKYITSQQKAEELLDRAFEENQRTGDE